MMIKILKLISYSRCQLYYNYIIFNSSIFVPFKKSNETFSQLLTLTFFNSGQSLIFNTFSHLLFLKVNFSKLIQPFKSSSIIFSQLLITNFFNFWASFLSKVIIGIFFSKLLLPNLCVPSIDTVFIIMVGSFEVGS